MSEEKHQERQERFRRLFDSYYTGICRYFVRRVEANIVEDLASDVFLTAWRRLDDVPDKDIQWLYGVAANVLQNHWRTTQRRGNLEQKLQTEYIPDLNDTVEILVRRGLTQGLACAFAKLEPAEREVILLTHVEGLTTREAANVVGCSAVALRARVSRAQRKLKILVKSEQRHEQDHFSTPLSTSAEQRQNAGLLSRKEKP